MTHYPGFYHLHLAALAVYDLIYPLAARIYIFAEVRYRGFAHRCPPALQLSAWHPLGSKGLNVVPRSSARHAFGSKGLNVAPRPSARHAFGSKGLNVAPRPSARHAFGSKGLNVAPR